jgi:excinuclease ABC subunit C
MHKQIAQKIQELPQRPGVYLFKDKAGTVLYVGKAVKLKNRVSSYFKKDAGKDSQRIQNMIALIHDFDYIVTDNELESLILENNLIKQYKTKYNVLMRDDKNYLYVKINLHDEIPTISYARKIENDKAKYFGPYTDGASVRQTLRMLRRIFPYCANNKIGAKPCFYYHIQKCPGICFGKITRDEYLEVIQRIINFLDGRQASILRSLQSQMKKLANRKQYEKAAKIRDRIFALNRMMERQKLVYTQKLDQDVFSLHMEPTVAVVNLFRIREGKLIQKENFIIENTKQTDEEEIFRQFLPSYYITASNFPTSILLPYKNRDPELQTELQTLAERAGIKTKLKILSAFSGAKAELLKLGQENARQYLEQQSDKALLEEARMLAALKELQRVLGLPKLPGRMECFDISNTQGTNAVGSMVVFDYARPKKDQYRKFKIQKKDTPDDFAMMNEMLERRLARSYNGSSKDKWPEPDLIIIDGGKGQLSSAQAALKKFKLDIPMIGLAKRIEEIFLPGHRTPILLPHNSIALYLLQRIRDEAHRFAVTYHRKLRSQHSLASALDEIPGIGAGKKKKLLERFGSVAKIRSASLTDIAHIVGSKLAEKIKASL